MSVDLHLHTTASDGSLTPMELVKRADSLEYRAIAITDHDTVDGLEPALQTANDYRLEVIPGIEINTDFEGCEIHILGYYLDYQHEYLQKELTAQKQMRKKRAKRILDRLNWLGVDLDWEELSRQFTGEFIGRGHIARALVERGEVESWDQAFERYIGVNAPAYVPRDRLSPEQAISLIKKVKGIPVLAHPGLIEDQELIPRIVDMEIRGLEAIYYEHTPEQTRYYRRLARKYNLLVTGGSDCHGPGNKDGLRLGKMKLNYNIVEQLKQLRFA